MILEVKISGTKDRLDKAVATKIVTEENEARTTAAGDPAAVRYVAPVLLLLSTNVELYASLETVYGTRVTAAHNSYRQAHVSETIDKSELRQLIKTLDPDKLDELETFLLANQMGSA